MLNNLMKKSINKRLSLAFILLAFSPLVLLGITLTWLSYVAQRDQALHMQREVSEIAEKQIVNYFRSLEDYIALPLRIGKIMEQSSGRQSEILSVIRSYGIKDRSNIFDEIMLLDQKGKYLAGVSRVSILSRSEYGERRLTDELLSPMRNNRVHYSPVSIDEKSGEPSITMGMPFSR